MLLKLIIIIVTSQRSCNFSHVTVTDNILKRLDLIFALGLFRFWIPATSECIWSLSFHDIIYRLCCFNIHRIKHLHGLSAFTRSWRRLRGSGRSWQIISLTHLKHLYSSITFISVAQNSCCWIPRHPQHPRLADNTLLKELSVILHATRCEVLLHKDIHPELYRTEVGFISRHFSRVEK